MFRNHYYHGVTKSAVAIFGSLFNNLTVVRSDGSGNTLNQIKVPLAYGPKQKFLARLDQPSGNTASLAIKLPRISFEITSIAYDTGSKLSKFTSITRATDDPTKKEIVNLITPYKINMELSIMAKNQDDALQILEQIIPSFSPEYTVTIKPLQNFSEYKQDVPIVLNSVAIADDYIGDFTTRRSIVYTLSFEMKIKYFGPIGDKEVIREVNIDFSTLDDMQFEEMDLTIDPTTAGPNDEYDVNIEIR